MESSIWMTRSGLWLFWRSWRTEKRASQSGKLLLRMVIRRALPLSLIVVGMATLSVQARSQSQSYSEDSSDFSVSTASVESPDMVYIPPTQVTKLKTYAFDAFGPYAIVSGAFLGGIDQATNTPPEWQQGFGGYSQRFGSDFGIAAAGTTTRYLLAGALKQDTLYYRCGCGGLFPRLRHAVVSTLTGRSGRDGHRVFSIPALVAPYAGSLTAVYGWYPSRFEAKDAFRMGNYSLLESIGSNIGLEFFYSGPHSLLSRMHLNNSHGAPTQGPKP
jgi:hypothetical protein